jgi:hypothetical protein
MADEWDRPFEAVKDQTPHQRELLHSGQTGPRDLLGISQGRRYRHKKPSEEEALMIVKAIAKMSKRRKS